MKLYTKNYLNFKIIDDTGKSIKEIDGFQSIKPGLPGDYVTDDGTFIKHTEHPLLVGVLYLQSKVKYGMTSKGVPIYLFEPLDKAYPLMIAGSTEKPGNNVLATARFESWDISNKFARAALIRIIGQCGNIDAEKESLLLRYSPWMYPKSSYMISEKYDIALSTRPFIQGFTFNIDPPGCEDVDDVFTLKQISEDSWDLTISITDVASAIDPGSPLDIYAQKTGQSLYPDSRPPKHMLPPNIGIKELSLLPDLLRNCISLCIRWNPSGIESINWSLSTILVNRSYTYKEAQNESKIIILKEITEYIAKTSRISSEEWVETLMIYYNSEAGKLLKKHSCGILRHHSQPDLLKLNQWTSIHPDLKMLAYSSAKYVTSDIPGSHWGLGITDYAHASSPLRRYADLYNQRCLINIIEDTPIKDNAELLCYSLNILQKNAKAFDRDLFFLTNLSSKSKSIQAIVLETDTKQKTTLWVPEWKRSIRIKHSKSVNPKQDVTLHYYVNYESARWKDKIVFEIIDANIDYPELLPPSQATDLHPQIDEEHQYACNMMPSISTHPTYSEASK